MLYRIVVSILLVLPLIVGFRVAGAGQVHEALRRERSPLRPSMSSVVVRRMVLGHSTQGRPIIAFHLGDPTSETKILVVGCIHGNECAGTAIARALIAAPPTDIDLWVIRNLNPDGSRVGTRQNGRGVDLNRNFPYRWRPMGRPWDKEYSGPHPLSEPEDRIARRLIARVHPDVSIWFHQPLALVVRSAGRHHDPASIRRARRTAACQARGPLPGQRHQLAEPLAPRGGRVRRRAAERIAGADRGRSVRQRDRERGD